MEKLRLEIKKAREISNKALNRYLKTNKQSDYMFYKQCFEYLRGLTFGLECLKNNKEEYE